MADRAISIDTTKPAGSQFPAAVQDELGEFIDPKYEVPVGGIPYSDLSAGVKASLDTADASDGTWRGLWSHDPKPPDALTFWGDKPDSSVLPTVEDTGQPVTHTGAPGKIEGGLLIADSTSLALYRGFGPPVAAPVTRIVGDFILGHDPSRTTDGGACAMVMLNQPSLDLDDPACLINVHYGFTNHSWFLQHYSGTDGWTPIAGEEFATDLTTDEVTSHRSEIYRQGDDVTIVLPTGDIKRVNNPLFGTDAGNYGFIEVGTSGLATDNETGIRGYGWGQGVQYPPGDIIITKETLRHLTGEVMVDINTTANQVIVNGAAIMTLLTLPSFDQPVMLDASFGQIDLSVDGAAFHFVIGRLSDGATLDQRTIFQAGAGPTAHVAPDLHYRLPAGAALDTYFAYILVAGGGTGHLNTFGRQMFFRASI